MFIFKLLIEITLHSIVGKRGIIPQCVSLHHIQAEISKYIYKYTHIFHFSKSKSRKRGLYISENSKCLLKAQS